MGAKQGGNNGQRAKPDKWIIKIRDTNTANACLKQRSDQNTV